MESEKTLEQKALVEKLTHELHENENYRTMLTKFVMDEKNMASPLFDRANALLIKLKVALKFMRERLKEADEVWLGYQLDDLDAELGEMAAELEGESNV